MTIIFANGIDLAVEDTGPDDAPTILLIKGLGAQLTYWPERFWRGLADRGFRVVRFDNRDAGLSSQISAPATGGTAPYTLFDMAEDTAGLIAALGLKAVHLVGVSMGGMIAQIVAATHPSRTLSLTSIMSTAGGGGWPAGTPAAMDGIFAPWPDASDHEAIVARFLGDAYVYRGAASVIDDAAVRRQAEQAIRRCYCPDGIERQRRAIEATAGREHLLSGITVPTLVLHGADDPLFPVAEGARTAALVPNAKLRVIDGMGHDMPDACLGQLVHPIADHCNMVAA